MSSNEKPQLLAKNAEASKVAGGDMVHTKWSLTIHHEDRGKRSIIPENKFSNFADLHAISSLVP